MVLFEPGVEVGNVRDRDCSSPILVSLGTPARVLLVRRA